MDNDIQSSSDDYIISMDDIDFTLDCKEMIAALSPETFYLQQAPSLSARDQGMERQILVDQEALSQAIMPLSPGESGNPSSTIQQFLIRNLDMSDHRHSLDGFWNGGEKDFGLRPSFYPTDEAGDLQWNATPSNASLSREPTRYGHSLNKSSWCPSPDPDRSQDFLQSSAVGDFRADVGKAPGTEGLVSRYDNPLTQAVCVLPPPNHRGNPVVLYRVDDKLMVDGNTAPEDVISLKRIEVYNPATGLWEIMCTDSSFSLNGSTYQNTNYKDSENREFLCCIDILDAEGTKGVVMYDLKKKKWVQGSIKRPIPLVRSELNMVSRLVTTHILGCGGSIFVYSEQEIGKDIYSCIHKFNPDSFGDGIWEEIYVRLKTTGGQDLRGSQAYPEFIGVQPLSATLVECGGSAFVFSEQESGKEVYICIQSWNCTDGTGDGQWEEAMRRKRKRHRSPNWKSEEITAFLKSKVDALEAVKGKPDWDYISESLEKAGFNRGPQACEDLWGTQLKRLTDIENYVQVKNIPGTSSSWVDIWNMRENERVANNLPRVFTLDWYQMMERIHGKKPRKKVGGKKQQRPADGNASTSLLNSTVTSSSSSGLMAVDFPASSLAFPKTSTVPLAVSFHKFDVADEVQNGNKSRGSLDLTARVSSLCNFLLEGRQNLTNNQIAKTKDEAFRIVQSSVQLEILRERNRERDCTNPRRSKSRKRNIAE